MAINKVVYGGSTLIDITDTTATASDVLNGKYFYAADGTRTQGTAVESGISIVESQDSGGGTIISINGDATTVEPITIMENGVITAPTGIAYSPVTVNVSGGVDYLALRATNQLTSYENSEITTVKAFTFRACTNLTSINLPNLETIGTSGFYGCTGLTHVFFDKLTQPGNQGFMSCSNLKTFVSKKAIYSNSGSEINACTNLEAFDMGSGSGRIAGNFFTSDGKLKIIVIRSNTVSILASTNAFTSTPFASDGTGGILYVPNDMISSYQSASNWSTILGYANNQIKSIESTHTDPTAPIDLTLYYVDGTPISS